MSSCEPSLLRFRGLGAVLRKQHKDPGRESGGHWPFGDQANTSPPEFCRAGKKRAENIYILALHSGEIALSELDLSKIILEV